MKTFKLVPVAAMLMLTTTVQATPVETSESLTLESLWQWLLPQENKPELKTCPDYPHCKGVTAPAPESDD